MKIMGIDPGGTSGLALLEFPTLHVVAHAEVMFDTELLSVLNAWKPDAVAIEDFVGSGPRSTYAILTLKLIGYVRGICATRGLSIVEQDPGKRRPHLKRAHELLPKGSRHELDALAHALAYSTTLEVVHDPK